MASIKQSFKVEGLKELDATLGELTKATGRNVLKRVLVRAAEPIREMAARLAPDDPKTTGIDLKRSIIASAKVKNTTGNAEFAAVMRGRGSEADAVSALRSARRAAKGQGSFAEIHVGPRKGRNAQVGAFQEFGTVNHPAQPFMRPAFDAQKQTALDIITRDLKGEIDKAVAKARKKKAKASRPS